MPDPTADPHLTHPAFSSGPVPVGPGGRVVQGPRFVPRSVPPPVPSVMPDPALDLPSSRQLGVLLAMVVVLQALSWWILEGYQLADSVEYMERAHGIVRGERLGAAEAIRSFGFSTLLVPFFAVGEWLDLESMAPVVWAVRILQVLLGLALVRVCARLAARMGGAAAGFVAAWIVGVNPVFLQYSVSPVSGIAAALCVGCALDKLLVRGGFRRGLQGGLWLGGGLLMAYQTIIISLPLLALVFLRDRLRAWRYQLGLSIGLGLGVLAQIGLDRLVYREWGVSLYRYVLENGASLTYRLLYRIPGLENVALKIYRLGLDVYENQPRVNHGGSPLRELFPNYWYLSNLTDLLVWPVAFLVALGLLRCVRRPSWGSWTLVIVLVLNVGFMSLKGSKDFRLWLPLLPLIAPIAALGWKALWGQGLRASSFERQLFAIGVLGLALVLGTHTLLGRNTRKFSGFWRAMDLIAVEARKERGDDENAPKVRVSSAYHWAVYLRETRDIELIKFHQIFDDWGDLSLFQRERVLSNLEDLDWFIVHLPVLANHPDLLARVNRLFEVYTMFWDREFFEDTGPIFVLRARTGSSDARTFFQVFVDADPDAYRGRNHLTHPIDFARDTPRGEERITLLGWKYEPLPGDRYGWITYHWYCHDRIKTDFTIVDRLTSFDERNSWQNNHLPAYGVFPTTRWKPGWIIRESWPVVAATDPFHWDAPYRPMGGAYRRGDLIPAFLWIEIVKFGQDGTRIARLEPVLDPSLAARSPTSSRFSKDGLLLVGRFHLPVHPTAHLRDDGRPVPD